MVSYMLRKRLIELRKKHKKTQKEMADLLGITRPAYTAYESGNRHPDYESLLKIAEFFDVSTDYLLGATDNPTRTEKDQKLKDFLEQPGVPYDENTYIPEEKLKALRELLESVAEKLPDSEEGEKDK